jgi:hypothetical protein
MRIDACFRRANTQTLTCLAAVVMALGHYVTSLDKRICLQTDKSCESWDEGVLVRLVIRGDPCSNARPISTHRVTRPSLSGDSQHRFGYRLYFGVAPIHITRRHSIESWDYSSDNDLCV